MSLGRLVCGVCVGGGEYKEAVANLSRTYTCPRMHTLTPPIPMLCSGVHAMGGMAAQIPIKDNAAANEAALTKVSRRAVMRSCTDNCPCKIALIFVAWLHPS